MARWRIVPNALCAGKVDIDVVAVACFRQSQVAPSKSPLALEAP